MRLNISNFIIKPTVGKYLWNYLFPKRQIIIFTRYNRTVKKYHLKSFRGSIISNFSRNNILNGEIKIIL